MPRKHRDYEFEYKTYHGTEEQRANRAARNKARRDAEKEGRVKKGDGKELDHVKPLSKGGAKDGKTKVVSRKTNRKKYNKKEGEK